MIKPDPVSVNVLKLHDRESRVLDKEFRIKIRDPFRVDFVEQKNWKLTVKSDPFLRFFFQIIVSAKHLDFFYKKLTLE